MDAYVYLELKEATAERFKEWFGSVAKPAVHIEVIDKEMLIAFHDQLQRGTELVYRLGESHTLSGRAEHFHVEPHELDGIRTRDGTSG